MSEAQSLALVLAVLYLAEQTIRVLPASVVFRRRYGGGWDAVRARPWSAFSGRANVMAPLLPPLHGVVVATPWPVTIAPEGVTAWPPDGVPTRDASDRPVPWDEIRETDARGAELVVNGRRFADCGSPAIADHLADRIAELARTPAEGREERIAAEIVASLDPDAARARVATWTERRSLPVLAAHAVFALVATAVVLMAWGGVHPVWWILLLLLALPVHLLGVWAFVRAHRAIHPGRSRGRVGAACVLAVAPLESAHVDTTLARDLAPLSHASAVAAALGEDDARRRLAAEAIRRLRHPRSDERPADPDGARAWEWHRALTALELAARNPDALDAPPPAADPQARSRCPRCLALHARAAGDCADCSGVPLVPLAA